MPNAVSKPPEIQSIQTRESHTYAHPPTQQPPLPASVQRVPGLGTRSCLADCQIARLL